MRDRIRIVLLAAAVLGVLYLVVRARIELFPPEEREELLRALDELALTALLVLLGVLALGFAFGPALGLGVAVAAGVTARGIQVLFHRLADVSLLEMAAAAVGPKAPGGGAGGTAGGTAGGGGGGTGAPAGEEPDVFLRLCYWPDGAPPPGVHVDPVTQCEISEEEAETLGLL